MMARSSSAPIDERDYQRSRVAVVTGGARGLGYAAAAQLASNGYRVAIFDISERDGDGDELADRLPGTPAAHCYRHVDVTSKLEVTEAITHVERRLGPPLVLINNAGALRSTRFHDIDEAEWDLVMNVSIKGAVFCTQACLPAMLEAQFGRIVNVSSTAGKTVSTLGGAHYTSAKSALLGLTRAVAHEVAPHGVTVNAVCPGLFETEMVTQTIGADAIATLTRSFPVPRLGKPAEVGALIGFLCGDDAAYITGAAIDINGGDLMV